MDITKSNVAVVALEWEYKITRAKKDLEQLGRSMFIEIRYEDLVEHAENTLHKICKFLGLPFERAMLEYWKTRSAFIGEHHSDLIFKPPSKKSIGK